MPSPVLDARLRAPAYTVIEYSPDITPKTKDIIFQMKVNRIQKDISDGARALYLPSFITETLSLGLIKYVITVQGVFVEDATHASHTTVPVADGVVHDPDFIDYEEATILFNHDFSKQLVELQIEFGGDQNTAGTAPIFRIYEGLILSMELVITAGHAQGDFTMQFGVAWSEDTPTLREWA